MPDYNLSEAFAVIEDYLIDSMRRNMLRHIAQEQREYFSWSQWQADMLSGLREYKRENADKFKGIYPVIEQKIEDAMQEAYDTGEATQEQVILSAIRKGYTAYRPKNTQNGEFFRMNKRKMNALVTETQKSMTKATAAALRMANDQYRSIIFGAQVFYNAGAGTLWQAVDMASKKFLQAGLNCIEYRDGRRVNIASYAEMALRTANTRAYLHGEAAMRERYGIHTVIVNRHNAACPLCVPFQGRVFIDDVWGGGTAAEAQVKGYPLLSEAMAAGLYHPNCKDGHTTFFVGINEFHPPTSGMKEEQVRRYELQQQQRYHERQIRKYKRLCQGTIDVETRIGYTKKLHEWQGRTQELIDANPGILRRSPPREQLRNIPEELGITPPRNPPGVEIFASVKPPSEPPKKDKIRSVIDVKAYSTPKKPPPSIGPSEAERKRDIERIKAKVRMVKEKADDMETDAKIARERALFATENAKAADYNAKRIRRASAEEIHSIKAKAKIRDKQVTRQMWDAKLSAAEARRLRRIAEIDKTEARAAQRRYVTLMKLDNDGKLKVSVETRTAHPTAVTVKPTPQSRPVASVSVKAKQPVTVRVADERRKDIETIRAKVKLVRQRAAELEQQAQAAKAAAEAAEARAQAATRKAQRAQQTVDSLRAKTKLREQQFARQVRDAKLSAADARKLRASAEVAKAEARAAQRRYMTIIRSDEDSRITASAGAGSGSGSDSVSVTIKTSPEREKMIRKISEQPWMQQIKPEQRDDIIRMFAGMDDRRLRFWEKYGKLIKGDLYSQKGPHTYKGFIEMNLSRKDPRSAAAGYSRTDIVAFLHESGHVFDRELNLRWYLPTLRRKMQDDFLRFTDGILGTSNQNCVELASDRKKGIYHALDHYHLFSEEDKKRIIASVAGRETTTKDIRSSILDMMEGLTNYQIQYGYGHPTNDYWRKDPNNISREAIAHLFEAVMKGGVRYTEFRRFFPETMQYFEDYFNTLM